MELTKNDLIKAAGAMINEAGINALTIDKLAIKMGINPLELSAFFKQDNDVLIMMLLSLDNEIQQLIHDVVSNTQLPEEELNSLFKNLYKFFDQKPYYLSIIFAADLMENDSDIQDILLRIKKTAEVYLFEVINQGKQKKLFNNTTTTKSIVNKILVSFRMLMNEQQVSLKLVRDFEIQRRINE
jgi:AcrR family transcriptional regulator